MKQLIRQSDKSRKEQFSLMESIQCATLLIKRECRKEGVSFDVLKTGGRRQKVQWSGLSW